jgi:hypothetical protein
MISMAMYYTILHTIVTITYAYGVHGIGSSSCVSWSCAPDHGKGMLAFPEIAQGERRLRNPTLLRRRIGTRAFCEFLSAGLGEGEGGKRVKGKWADYVWNLMMSLRRMNT